MMISFENGQTLDDMIAALTKLKAAMSLNARLVKKGKIYLTMKWDNVAVRLSPEDAPDCAIQELIYRDGELQVRLWNLVRAKSLRALSILVVWQGNIKKARILAEESLAISKDFGDQYSMAAS